MLAPCSPAALAAAGNAGDLTQGEVPWALWPSCNHMPVARAAQREGCLCPRAARSTASWPTERLNRPGCGLCLGWRHKAKGSAPDTAETIASSFSLRAGRIDGGRGNAASYHPGERGRYAAPLPPPPTDRSHSYLERVEGILHLSHFLFHGTAAALDLLLQGVLAMLDARQLLHCFCEARLQLRG